MNVLVTGSNGQLGRELRRLALESPYHFIFTDVNEMPGEETVYLDVTNKDAVKIIADSEKVDVIVNCAAYTNVEKAEEEIFLADLLNHHAVEGLAEIAAERNALMIHISTDYIYSGDGCLPIREDELPAPHCVYGSTKLAGEIALAKSACRSVTLRTSWLYSPYGKNFVKTMRQQMAARPYIKVVSDQVGTPTSAADLAEVVMAFVNMNNISGKHVYHYSNEGAISWYDFAHAIKDICGYDCDVQACRTEEYPTKASRPHYSVLDKGAIRSTLGIRIPYWRDSLVECIRRMDFDA